MEEQGMDTLPEEIQTLIYGNLPPSDYATMLQIDRRRRRICEHPFVRREVFGPHTIPLILPTPLKEFPVLAQGDHFLDIGNLNLNRWLIVGYKYNLDASGEFTNEPKGVKTPFAALVFIGTDRRGGYYDHLVLEDETRVGIYSKIVSDYWDWEDLDNKEEYEEEMSYDEGNWEYWGKQEFTFKGGDAKNIDIPVNFWSTRISYDSSWSEYCKTRLSEEELEEELEEEFEEELEEELEEEVREMLMPSIEGFIAIENVDDLITFAQM